MRGLGLGLLGIVLGLPHLHRLLHLQLLCPLRFLCCSRRLLCRLLSLILQLLLLAHLLGDRGLDGLEHHRALLWWELGVEDEHAVFVVVVLEHPGLVAELGAVAFGFPGFAAAELSHQFLDVGGGAVLGNHDEVVFVLRGWRCGSSHGLWSS